MQNSTHTRSPCIASTQEGVCVVAELVGPGSWDLPIK